MYSATATGSVLTVENVFDEIRDNPARTCQLCNIDVAAYRWSQYGTGGNQRDIPICRVCAGMILLIGKSA